MTDLPKIPSVADPDVPEEHTRHGAVHAAQRERRPYLIHLAGPNAGECHRILDADVIIGRGPLCALRVSDANVSRQHARVSKLAANSFVVDDCGSANGTFVNGRRIDGRAVLQNGDKIELSNETILKFALYDELDERYEHRLLELRRLSEAESVPLIRPWSVMGWKANARAMISEGAEATAAGLAGLPPLVTSAEVEELKRRVAAAQEGRQFLLHAVDPTGTRGGAPPLVANTLKILVQMSLVLVRKAGCPVISVAGLAETHGGDTSPMLAPLPSPLVRDYFQASATLNFIRALASGGFADLRRTEFFDLSSFDRAALPVELRERYERMCEEISHGLQFISAMGRSSDELMKVTFYASHEARDLDYHAALTRRRPRREGFYDLVAHLPWVDVRDARRDGPHLDFLRGIANTVGVKVDSSATAKSLVALCDVLNPHNDPGKIVLMVRLGAKDVRRVLPALLEGVRAAQRRVLWVCDPLSGNGGDFDRVLEELASTAAIHRSTGTVFGGVHFDVTGEDVCECRGEGFENAEETATHRPRLNYAQAIQLAIALERARSR
jgi:3-deoxy-7-phosphoheptulonate synthase